MTKYLSCWKSVCQCFWELNVEVHCSWCCLSVVCENLKNDWEFRLFLFSNVKPNHHKDHEQDQNTKSNNSKWICKLSWTQTAFWFTWSLIMDSGVINTVLTHVTLVAKSTFNWILLISIITTKTSWFFITRNNYFLNDCISPVTFCNIDLWSSRTNSIIHTRSTYFSNNKIIKSIHTRLTVSCDKFLSNNTFSKACCETRFLINFVLSSKFV